MPLIFFFAKVIYKSCVCAQSLQFNSLQPHGLQHARLFCPWDYPGKNTGVGCHCFLHGILTFPTQGLNPCLLHCRQILHPLSQLESPYKSYILYIYINRMFFIVSSMKKYSISMCIICVFFFICVYFLYHLFFSKWSKFLSVRLSMLTLWYFKPSLFHLGFFFLLPKAIDYLLDPVPVMSAVTSVSVWAPEWTPDAWQ